MNSRRWGHSATAVPAFDWADPIRSSNLWLIGGWDSQSQYSDVHVLNVDESTLEYVSCKSPPSCRAGHSATAVGSDIVLFGGAICEGGPYTFHDDLHILDTKKARWQVVNKSGLWPPARAQHACVLLSSNRLLVVGGYSNRVLCDCWLLDLTTSRWSALKSEGAPSEIAVQTENFRVFPARHSVVVISSSSELDEHILLVVGYGGKSNHELVVKPRLQQVHWREHTTISGATRSAHVSGVISTNHGPQEILLLGGRTSTSSSLNAVVSDTNQPVTIQISRGL